MKKNKILFEVLAHIIGWLIFLSIPFLFSHVPPSEIGQEFKEFYLTPIFINSLFLILLFYFNYFILIPKFLFTNHYFIYTLLILACIGIKLVSPTFMMFFFDKPPHNNMPHESQMEFMMPLVFSNSVLMYIVIFLASIGLRLNSRWKLAEQERLQSELSSLKSQINPHFLFNTLNSIYAETLGKADNASEMLIKLSDIMRYSITEAHHDKVSLQKELDYITNYIELQKLRLASKAKLEYRVEGESQALQIAPFLLIPFIENAFKYGVNSEQNSSIRIELITNNTKLNLTVFNKKVEIERTIQETIGLGIKNTRQRLSLIYPENHLLTINETDSDFNVSLHINLA
ncbi:MAG TPA: hypothetical protein DDX39_01595 [Bacteroidales bacterium]|nr:MAG: hypothetical protein A2W98_07810 [Bacteroidetes bacterium GWF2_33_38]OFY72362.1 MAG: hypothetical protein A2265_07320 [Bacteroidetes bacterium RIFOXYA12_FULL_33_9]HBF87305.1 hypothetical protein [Bacteroidales bacterium]